MNSAAFPGLDSSIRSNALHCPGRAKRCNRSWRAARKRPASAQPTLDPRLRRKSWASPDPSSAVAHVPKFTMQTPDGGAKPTRRMLERQDGEADRGAVLGDPPPHPRPPAADECPAAPRAPSAAASPRMAAAVASGKPGCPASAEPACHMAVVGRQQRRDDALLSRRLLQRSAARGRRCPRRTAGASAL